MASPSDVLKVTEIIDGVGFKAVLSINLSGTPCPVGTECRYTGWPLPFAMEVGQYITGTLTLSEDIWVISDPKEELPKSVLMVRSFAINMKNPGANGIRLEVLVDAKFVVNGSKLPDWAGGFQNNEVVVSLAPDDRGTSFLVVVRIPGGPNNSPASYGYSIISVESVIDYIVSRGYNVDKTLMFKAMIERINTITGQIWEGGITPAFPIYFPEP